MLVKIQKKNNYSLETKMIQTEDLIDFRAQGWEVAPAEEVKPEEPVRAAKRGKKREVVEEVVEE